MLKASSLILLTSENKIILQLRDKKKDVYFRGCWGLIGGAAQKEETASQCMVRECLEEIGWRPDYLRPLFIIREHCEETVFISYIKDASSLICMEGEKIVPFNFSEINCLPISPYHRRIIDRFFATYDSGSLINSIKVLFYSKVMPPSFGGYVVAGYNFFRLLSCVTSVTLVTDNTLTDLSVDERFDILFFNATYESSNIFNVLSKQCKQVWTYEHNVLSKANSSEVLERYNIASRILVPSDFLKEAIHQCPEYGMSKQIGILPIPIDESIFSFNPHKIEERVRFITCCAIKEVRNLSFTLLIMKEIFKINPSFEWNIYGDIPYLGDVSYLIFLRHTIDELGLSDVVHFHKALVSQYKIAEVLHQSDFYVDFAYKETYGMAKIEAALSGVKMILPPCDNNKIFPQQDSSYCGSPKEIARLIINTISKCREHPKIDMSERKKVRKSLMQYSRSEVINELNNLVHESV